MALAFHAPLIHTLSQWAQLVFGDKVFFQEAEAMQ